MDYKDIFESVTSNIKISFDGVNCTLEVGDSDDNQNHREQEVRRAGTIICLVTTSYELTRRLPNSDGLQPNSDGLHITSATTLPPLPLHIQYLQIITTTPSEPCPPKPLSHLGSRSAGRTGFERERNLERYQNPLPSFVSLEFIKIIESCGRIRTTLER